MRIQQIKGNNVITSFLQTFVSGKGPFLRLFHLCNTVCGGYIDILVCKQFNSCLHFHWTGSTHLIKANIPEWRPWSLSTYKRRTDLGTLQLCPNHPWHLSLCIWDYKQYLKLAYTLSINQFVISKQFNTNWDCNTSVPRQIG